MSVAQQKSEKTKLDRIDRIRNIGISAHIDSGKTTLTERILFYTGKIHRIEEVKGKSGIGATMDYMDLEREKGITIQSAATFCEWGDYNINIIDTPGHVDFTIEVERALRVLDGAVLVLCGVAGVQSQSITVDRQMKRYGVPRLAFVNKLDRQGANPFRVKDMLREKLGLNSVMYQIPIGLEDQHQGSVDLIKMKAFFFDGDNGENIREEEIPDNLKAQASEYREKMIETLADVNDEIAEKFLNGQAVTNDEIIAATRKAVIALKIVPVYCGSAYKNKGVQLLLDAVATFLPSPRERTNIAFDQENKEAQVTLSAESDKPFVGLAFKLEDGRYGQLTYLRVYQGSLKKGEFIYNVQRDNRVKVGRLVRMHADKMVDIDSCEGGDIVAMFGIDCYTGDTFCNEDIRYSLTQMFVPDPVVKLAVKPKEKSMVNNFSKGLNRFSKEDPTFKVSLDPESNETLIAGMGELHLEVYVERLKREYQVECETGMPQVAYRETITKATTFDYTHKKQTGGQGQFAKIVGLIEPGEQNYEFVDEIVGGRIPREFIPAVDKGFAEQVQKGSLIGFPVVNVRFRLQDGAFHEVDSSEMAFRICAMAAFREAYPTANPVILEPIMKVECETPEEFQGSVLGGLNQRRGMIQGSTSENTIATITAEVPLSEMFGYANDIRSSTQGKATFTMEFSKYAPVPRQKQEELVKKYQEKRAAENK
ncbi:MAG: elongation factor G [Deltaproteobacteria bacterium CG11_big_fil_rev_8_21_14_0_20_45_16]|nr:MAG: elongation factor G [Deltaproteobacteria bacterium CG11_big_fil_rev_8_21_14_0_20_45_16]